MFTTYQRKQVVIDLNLQVNFDPYILEAEEENRLVSYISTFYAMNPSQARECLLLYPDRLPATFLQLFPEDKVAPSVDTFIENTPIEAVVEPLVEPASDTTIPEPVPVESMTLQELIFETSIPEVENGKQEESNHIREEDKRSGKGPTTRNTIKVRSDSKVKRPINKLDSFLGEG